MLRVPLLSETYAVALFHEDRPEPPSACPEPEPRASAAAAAPVSFPADDDDLETAPTRPLRLDQIHL